MENVYETAGIEVETSVTSGPEIDNGPPGT